MDPRDSLENDPALFFLFFSGKTAVIGSSLGFWYFGARGYFLSRVFFSFDSWFFNAAPLIPSLIDDHWTACIGKRDSRRVFK